jgi:predicted transcriptional regulator
MLTHKQLVKRLLRNPAVRAEYKALEPEFTLLDQLLKARTKAGLSQAEVARRMGTYAPAIARLEASLGSGKHSPSVATLRKYAAAVGRKLVIRLS